MALAFDVDLAAETQRPHEAKFAARCSGFQPKGEIILSVGGGARAALLHQYRNHVLGIHWHRRRRLNITWTVYRATGLIATLRAGATRRERLPAGRTDLRSRVCGNHPLLMHLPRPLALPFPLAGPRPALRVGLLDRLQCLPAILLSPRSRGRRGQVDRRPHVDTQRQRADRAEHTLRLLAVSVRLAPPAERHHGGRVQLQASLRHIRPDAGRRQPADLGLEPPAPLRAVPLRTAALVDERLATGSTLVGALLAHDRLETWPAQALRQPQR